jgi:hypothetical protein
MITEYENEPIKGLPGFLPKDETIVWQGSPDWRSMARGVFHTRLVTAWFVVVAMAAFVAGGTGPLGALITLLVAVVGLALLAGLLTLVSMLHARANLRGLRLRVRSIGTAKENGSWRQQRQLCSGPRLGASRRRSGRASAGLGGETGGAGPPSRRCLLEN